MKYFLYMNNDIVNSIISQAEQGLITEMMSETENGANKTLEKETKIGALARISTSFYKFLGAESEINAEKTNISGSEEHRISKEIVQKTLYDAAYNIAYNNINSNFQLKETTGDLGEYIELTGDFQFVDFDVLDSLFNGNGVISLIKQQAEKKIAEELSTNRETQSRNKSDIDKIIKELVAQNNKKIDELLKSLNVLKSIIPYKRMYLSNDGYIIPLDDKNLRDTPSSFSFKYGGTMTCVGYITNIIGEDCAPIDNNDIFSFCQHSINEIFRKLLPTNEKNLYIVNPIAIYYKNGEKDETN